MKKLFHRKKDSMPSSPEQRTENANANPSFRTSRYESAAPAGLPQTGQFPLKGRNSSVSLHGRRSETYNRGQGTGEIEPSPRPSSSSPYYGSLPAPRVTSASYGHAASGYSSADGPAKYGSESSSQRKQNPPPTAPPTQEFSNLNLRSPRDRVDQLEQEDFPLRQHRGQEGYALDAQETSFPPTRQDRRAYGEDSSPGIRMVGRARPTQPDERMPAQTTNAIGRDQEDYGYRDRSYDNPRTQATDYGVGYGAEDESVMRRRRSIPRKEVPDVTQTSSATYQTPGSFANPTDRTHRTLKSSSAPRYQYDDDHRSRAQEAAQTYPNVLGRSQRYTQDAPPSAQEVVDRARGNTYDTEVIEKIAPAVVHERVNKDVRHIREEVITKEIHDHDVYHRILPIIDVEVLPPRHFLPVEGGGLVEISGKEVPGRGNNWVIAETASKIPSDQAAPKGLRKFTARQFPGTEGDAMEYITPEGYPRTEQTWVHPPELETGGRDTGQTWPMEFEDENINKGAREHKTSKTPKPKRSGKSMEPQSSMVQQPRV